MNRHQRRKRALLRKADKLRKLASRAVQQRNSEITAKAFADPTTRRLERTPKGMVSGVYSAQGPGGGLLQMKGFGSGAFKGDDIHMTDGQERQWKKGIERRLTKRK